MYKRAVAVTAFISMAAAFTVFAEISMSDAILQKFAEQEKYYQLPTGVMAKIAKIESNGNASALNGSSQAGGLFQWIPRYWYDAAVKVYPAGGGALNPQSRFNPFIATEVTAYNLAYIRTVISSGVQAAKADLSVGLYMGHFLGAAGAVKFFAIMKDRPDASASQYFPKEAQYNSSVFGGRTIAGVYNLFAQKMSAPGITGVSNYDGTYTGPTTGRMMDANGNTALLQPYTSQPPMATFRTYPTTFNSAQDMSNANTSLPQQTTTPPPPPTGTQTSVISQNSNVAFPPASMILAQPAKVTRGDSIAVSWTSVGMNKSSVCQVFAGDSKIGEGNEGTYYFPTDANTVSTVTFSEHCVTREGMVVQKSTSVTIK